MPRPARQRSSPGSDRVVRDRRDRVGSGAAPAARSRGTPSRFVRTAATVAMRSRIRSAGRASAAGSRRGVLRGHGERTIRSRPHTASIAMPLPQRARRSPPRARRSRASTPRAGRGAGAAVAGRPTRTTQQVAAAVREEAVDRVGQVRRAAMRSPKVVTNCRQLSILTGACSGPALGDADEAGHVGAPRARCAAAFASSHST